MPPIIDKQLCVGCGTCADHCPLDCIYLEDETAVVRYPDECWHCGACRQDCPAQAITIEFSLIMLAI